MKATTTIPVDIELEYMLDQRRLLGELSFLTVASLGRRQDSDELLAFLELSAPQVLNEKRLRLRLRQIAMRMSNEKRAELALLLGRAVPLVLPQTVSVWVDEQVKAVQGTIEHWLAQAGDEIRNSRLKGMPLAEMPVGLRQRAKAAAGVAETRASAAVLQLNSQMIEEIAKGAGSTHYRWSTEEDDRVRDNHVPLHFEIHAWSSPPSGGGTKPGESGHPGSGWGCRCTAIPLAGPPL